MSTVGERIKKIRKEKGFTQKKLGEKTGIAESTIRRYEIGLLNPKLETIKKIAKALDISYSYLIGDTDIPYTNKVDLVDFEIKRLLNANQQLRHDTNKYLQEIGYNMNLLFNFSNAKSINDLFNYDIVLRELYKQQDEVEEFSDEYFEIDQAISQRIEKLREFQDAINEYYHLLPNNIEKQFHLTIENFYEDFKDYILTNNEFDETSVWISYLTKKKEKLIFYYNEIIDSNFEEWKSQNITFHLFDDKFDFKDAVFLQYKPKKEDLTSNESILEFIKNKIKYYEDEILKFQKKTNEK